MKSLESLTQVQLDAIQELGNIGVGNAATAMAQMLSSKVDISLPNAAIIPMEQMYDIFGHPEKWVSCVSVKFEGEAPCYFMFMFEQQIAYDLIDLMLGQSIGTTKAIDDMGDSILKELGNIVSGGFAVALGSMTGLDFVSTIPALASDMFGAILSSILITNNQIDDKFFLFETELSNGEQQVLGKIFLFPEPGSLEKILNQLGLE